MNGKQGFTPLIILIIVVTALVAGGVWYYQIHESSAPQSVSNSSSPSSSTVGWVTYSYLTSNQAFTDFEIQYPAGWILGEGSGQNVESISIDPKEAFNASSMITIYVGYNNDATSTIDNYLKISPSELAQFTNENITVGGVSAIKLSGIQMKVGSYKNYAGSKVIDILFTYCDRFCRNNPKKPLSLYEIHYLGPVGNYEGIFDKIIGSLRFIR